MSGRTALPERAVFSVCATLRDKTRGYVTLSSGVATAQRAELFMALCRDGEWAKLQEEFGNLSVTIGPAGRVEIITMREFCARQASSKRTK